MGIDIKVGASLDDDGLKQQLEEIREAFNRLGSDAAKASNVKFQPISRASVEEARRMRQEFEAMLRISPALRRTLEGTGQGGRAWESVDWSRAYPDQHQRQRYMATLLNRLRPGSVSAAGNTEPPTPTPRPSGAGVAGKMIGGVAQTGLRAMGPAGGVAANALGSGMSSGFGAGLAGLLGGMAALGVGKLAGGVAGKVDDAQREAIAVDTLKRALGDVNVSFYSLRESVRAAGDEIGVAFNDAAKLGTEFTKIANLTADQRSEVASGVTLGGGMARAFGLDPSKGVGALGVLRGMRQTGSDQESRKAALLIGETIARSGAFAKADEVMDALSGFAIQQTRASLGRAPLDTFSGQYAGLVGSGIAGLDPQGASAILNRALQALAGGGGKGEASQFFSGMIAERNGLNPIAGAVWRQSPMSTIGQAFAPDSAVGRYLKQSNVPLPTGGSGSFYSQTIDQLKAQYSDPWLRLNAAANHLGVNESQAAALLSTPAAPLGGLERRLGRLGVNLTDINGSGLGILGQIEGGDRGRLESIAGDLLGRRGKGSLTADEVRDLKAAMGGDDETLRDVLASISAQRGQVETEGSKTRDTIAGVDNTLQDYASKSLPLLNDSRAALMALAGRQLGGKGPQGIRELYLDSEHNDRISGIRQGFDRYAAEQGQRSRAGAITKETAQDNVRLATQQLGMDLKAEDERHKAAIEASRQEAAREREATDKARRRVIEDSGVSSRSGAGVSATLLDAVLGQESGGRHRNQSGGLITSPAGARGIAQVMPATGRDPGFNVRPLQDDSEVEGRRFGGDYLEAMLREFGGDKAKALAAYNAGPGRVKGAVRHHGDDWLQHMPSETQNYVPRVLQRERALQGTALPEDARAAEQASRPEPLAFGPLHGEMDLRLDLTPDARRLLQGPAVMPSSRVGPARPFGVA